MLTESVQERLKWIKKSCFEEVDGQISVGEKKQDGSGWEEEVVCYLERYAIAFSLEKRVIPSLRNLHPGQYDNDEAHSKCVDSIILEQLDAETWQLHLIECKKTIASSSGKWDDLIRQYEGGLLNAFALVGILGIQNVERVKLYTAFRKDNLTSWIKTNPSLLKPIGEDRKENRFIEWYENRVNVFSLKGTELIKIKLDEETGIGEVQLV